MIIDKGEWRDICSKLSIENHIGAAKVKFNFRKNVFEAQIFSSSSLEHVHHMGAFSIIRAGASIHSLKMGRFCAIGANLVCAPPEHNTDWIGSSSVFVKEYGWSKSSTHYSIPTTGEGFKINRVTVGSDVWVGRDVYVKGGVNVGDGAVIAAKSVVTKDVQPYTIVGGNPARIIRYRFDEAIREELLQLRWWNLDPSWMNKVDLSCVPEVIEYLKENKKNIPLLRPAAVHFDKNGYEVKERGA